MEKVDLSFAIVTYNNEKIIKDTVESLVKNIPNSSSYIIYVIDNNSSDNTLEIVKKIKGKIEVIETKCNKGFGYGHNIILNKLDSTYHFVVNPDIILENGQLEKMINYMENNIEVGLLSPLIVNPDHTIQYLCKKNPTVLDMFIRRVSPNLFSARQNSYVLKETGYTEIMNIDYATGCFMMFRTPSFKEISGFDEDFFMYLEDADITRRINQISNTVFFPRARVIHAWERGGHKSLKLAWITAKSMKVYFDKWGWKYY